MNKKINDCIPEIADYYSINENGDIFNNLNNKQVNFSVDSKGYKRINLKTTCGIFKGYFVSKLVCICFNGIAPNTMKNPVVTHIDNNKNNTNYLNLKWIEKNSNEYFNSNNKRYKYSDDTIKMIFKMYNDGKSIEEISNATNINLVYIYKILRGERRKECGDPNIINKQHEKRVNKNNILLPLCMRMIDTTYKYKDIMNEFNVSKSYISHIQQHDFGNEIVDLFNFKEKRTRIFDNKPEIGLNTNISVIGSTEYRFEEEN